MSLDSRMRLARKNGRGSIVKHFEVADVCEALALLRACEKAERAEKTNAADAAEPETEE